jgi:hypothetical protein
MTPRVRPHAGALAEPQPPPIETVDTSVWGAPLWLVLHVIAQNSAVSAIPTWRSLLAALRTDLPCPDCRAHYGAWYTSRPPSFHVSTPVVSRLRLMPRNNTAPSTAPLIKWLTELHNNVNLRTGRSAWNGAADVYGRQRIPEARVALDGLQGTIGPAAWRDADALLRSL